MSDDCTHKVRHSRDPEQTMLKRRCQRCGDVVMVSVPSHQPGDSRRGPTDADRAAARERRRRDFLGVETRRDRR